MVKKVVIIGAGYAGTEIAKRLDKRPQDVQVTVIDPRECQVHKIGGLRAAVDPNWPEMVLVPRDNLVHGKNKVVNGAVKAIKDKKVILEDSSKIQFDYLVAASGAQNFSPGEPGSNAKTLKQMTSFFSSTAEVLKRSKNVVIVGGGVVGVEFAGEIRDQFPDMKITVVHSGPTFINRADPPLFESFHRELAKLMKKRGIKYVLNDKVNFKALSDFSNGKPFVEIEGGTVATVSGKEIAADVVFVCTGTKLNNSFYPENFTDETGHIKTLPTFQVVGFPNVFAAGDITNLKENKLAYFASSVHAPTVANNILKLAKGKTSLKTYHPSAKPLMAVPLGKKYGLVQTPIFIFGSFITSIAKGRSLFTSMSWKANNAKQPTGYSNSELLLVLICSACCLLVACTVPSYILKTT